MNNKQIIKWLDQLVYVRMMHVSGTDYWIVGSLKISFRSQVNC